MKITEDDFENYQFHNKWEDSSLVYQTQADQDAGAYGINGSPIKSFFVSCFEVANE